MNSTILLRFLSVCSLLLAFVGVAGAAGVAPQPVICSRACWGARSTPANPFGTTTTWNRATIHHTANAGDFNVVDINGSKARVRGTQDYHMDVNGWSDIGYHFLADKFGNSFEGLNGSLGSGFPRGAHDAINNASIGVNMLGWFDSGQNGDSTAAQRNAVYDIVAWKIPNPFTGYGSSAYGTYGTIGYVCGHYQVSAKTCPGTFNQPRIGTNYSGGEMRDAINQRIVGSGPYVATYVSNSFPATVEAGAYVTVSVTYKNSGTSAWTANTKLATAVARDRASAFYNSADWPANNRATIVDGSSVAPGANGTFTFIAKAPTTTGSYQENFELVQEGVTWFEGAGDNVIWYVDVVAPPAYRAQYVSNSFPATVTANSLVTASVTFKNTGANAWDANTRLGTSNPRERSSGFYNSADWFGANRPTAVDASTAVGANGTFTFIAKAPATAGAYQENFELLQEGVTWFQGDGVIWYVTVNPAPTPTPTATPLPPADIIIDNTSANVVYTGSWLTGTASADKYGADYRYANSGSGAEASYHFNPTQPGTYRISVYYPQGANRASNAPHRIDHNSGSASYAINQQTAGGTWVTVGTHYFNTSGYCVVRTTGANGTVVMADAVKVTYVGP